MFVETLFNALAFLKTYLPFIGSLAAILLFRVYKRCKLDVWEKQGVSGPTPIPIVGNSLDNFIQSMHSLLKHRHAKYGRIYGYYEMSKPVISVAEPEILRHVLVKDSDVFFNRRPNPSPEPIIRNMLISLRDEKGKKTRAIMSPTFTSGKIKKMATIINRCINSLIENVDSKVKKNEEIDIKALYGAFTMDVIASCAFATKTNAYKNPNDPFVMNAKSFIHVAKWKVFLLLLTPKFVRRAFNLNAVSSSVISFFRNTTKAIIEERRKKNIIGDDFMQLLLDAKMSSNLVQTMKDINQEQLNKENQEEIEKNAKLLMTDNSDAKLTEDELLAQCLIFFIAGYETTASLLSYTSYALALNPEVQNVLYKEVKHYFDTKGDITYETISEMKYLNAVINESLRMYSPVLRIEREAIRDYKLPNTDIIVPKGGLITVPLHVIHHDENNFREPDDFKPERFLPENVDEIKPYTFLPFGGGPRNCIGMRFALMEAKLALCKVILQFEFVRSENTDVPLKLKNSAVSLFPVERVIAKCEKRK